MPPTTNPYFLVLQIRFNYEATDPEILHIPVNGKIEYIGHSIEKAFDDAGALELSIGAEDPFKSVAYDETTGLAGVSKGDGEEQIVKRGQVLNVAAAVGDATEGIVSFTILIKQDV